MFHRAQWPIYQGPRNKSLATRHLEYLAYVCIEDPAGYNFFYTIENNLYCNFNEITFPVTKLLQSPLDFEQFEFTQEQLKIYALSAKRMINNFTPLTDYPELSAGEQYALHAWTCDDYFEDIQNLLRNGKIDKIPLLPFCLSTLCVASYALGNLKNKITVKKAVRNEKLERINFFLVERAEHVVKQQLIVNKGFTAATLTNKLPSLFSANQMKTVLYPTASQGKYIDDFSFYKKGKESDEGEREVLFPPHTQFQYLPFDQKKKFWRARPVRAVDAEDKGEYEHGLSELELQKIEQEKSRLKLRSLYEVFKPYGHTKSTFYGYCFARFPKRNNINKILAYLKLLGSTQTLTVEKIEALISDFHDLRTGKNIFATDQKKSTDLMGAITTLEKIKEDMATAFQAETITHAFSGAR